MRGRLAKNGTPQFVRTRQRFDIFAPTNQFKAMPKELLQKSFACRIEQKSEKEDGSLHIKAYVCAYGNVDSWGDIIAPTACDDFLKSEDAGRMKLCYQHNSREVIGVITDKKSDAIGLLIEADILPTNAGKDAILLLKNGAIDEFSIGYYADRYHYEKREGYDYDIRVLDAITIIEASPVTRAANPKAILLDAKSDDFQNELKSLTDDQLAQLKAAIEDEEARRFIAYL